MKECRMIMPEAQAMNRRSKETISLKSGLNNDFCLKAFQKRNSIGLKISSIKQSYEEPKESISIEMTDKMIDEEKSAIMESSGFWPNGTTVSNSGRIRNIEADSEIIEELQIWAESNGMKAE